MVQMLRHQDTINSNILLSVLDMCTDKSMENLTGQLWLVIFRVCVFVFVCWYLWCVTMCVHFCLCLSVYIVMIE